MYFILYFLNFILHTICFSSFERLSLRINMYFRIFGWLLLETSHWSSTTFYFLYLKLLFLFLKLVLLSRIWKAITKSLHLKNIFSWLKFAVTFILLFLKWFLFFKTILLFRFLKKFEWLDKYQHQLQASGAGCNQHQLQLDKKENCPLLQLLKGQALLSLFREQFWKRLIISVN